MSCICVFCKKKLCKLINHPIKDAYDIFFCKNCFPPNKTLFRQIYNINSSELIYDTISLDNFHIFRNYQLISIKQNTTFIYKNIIGILDNIYSDPFLNISEKLVSLDFVLKISSIESLKSKLNLYEVFI